MRREGDGANQRLLAVGPDLLGPLYERRLADEERGDKSAVTRAGRRRRDGIFYTPANVVDFMVEATLRPLVAEMPAAKARQLRILDPACGCGAFLMGAFRWLCRWYEASADDRLRPAQRRAIALRQLAGIDIDPVAVELARDAIGAEGGVSPDQLADNLRVGDALLEHDDWLFGRFDAVLTNPPYVNIRRLATAHGPALGDAYRRRYRCAAGAFDLYVLFLERSAAALRRGGRIGAIVPNKLATLDYARPCRELLLKQGTLDAVVDISSLGIFADAEVYPYIVLWTKRPAPRDHGIRVLRPASIAALSSVGRPFRAVVDGPEGPSYVLQAQQCAARGLTLGGDLNVEARAPTVPLAELCAIHSGATGFQAAELSARLVDRGAALNDALLSGEDGSGHRRAASVGEPGEGPAGIRRARELLPCFDFIVSGNIDPYAIQLGDVRFIGRQLTRPVLPAADPILTANKRRLYAGPKIVLAGMSRRLEAALDTRGLALGVQVYALADWKVDPLYLLGLLNSSLLTHLFRLRFAAKRLAGGYFSLSKMQLAQLPIRLLDQRDRAERRLHDQLVRLVEQRLKSSAARAQVMAALDSQIDELVLQLYRAASSELTVLPAAA